MPRTGNAVLWVGRSFREYSRVVAAHPEKAGEAYEAALEATHQACSERLLQLCQVSMMWWMVTPLDSWFGFACGVIGPIRRNHT